MTNADRNCEVIPKQKSTNVLYVHCFDDQYRSTETVRYCKLQYLMQAKGVKPRMLRLTFAVTIMQKGSRCNC